MIPRADYRYGVISLFIMANPQITSPANGASYVYTRGSSGAGFFTPPLTVTTDITTDHIDCNDGGDLSGFFYSQDSDATSFAVQLLDPEPPIGENTLTITTVDVDDGPAGQITLNINVLPATADLTTNLLRRYKLDEGTGTVANDSGSEAANGTLTNGPTWGAGKIGPSCVIFDGSNDTIVTSSAVTAPTDQLTVAAWVNVSAAGLFPMIVSNVNSGGGGGFELRLNSTAGKPEIVVGFGTLVTAAVIGPTSIVSAGWKHIAGVYNGTDLRLYVDGALVGSPAALTGDLTYLTVSPLRIGTRAGGTSFPYTGKVDDVRVYNRALSEDDILGLFAFTEPVASSSSPIVHSPLMVKDDAANFLYNLKREQLI